MLKNLIVLFVFIFTGSLGAQIIWESHVIDSSVTLYDVHAIACDTAIVVGVEENLVESKSFIYRTEDAGASWDTVYTVDNGKLLEMQFIDSLNGFIVGWQNDPTFGIPYTIVLKTTDGGLNWNLDATGLGEGQGFAISMIDESTGWVLAETNQLFETIVRCRSTGTSVWQDSCVFPGIPDGLENDVRDIFFLNDDFGWVSAKNSDSLYLTTNAGANWSSVKTPIQLDRDSKVYFFSDRFLGWILDANGSALLTTNGGLNWSIDPVLNEVLDMEFEPSIGSALGWALGRNGDVFVSSSGVWYWEQFVAPSNGLKALSLCHTCYLVGENGAVLTAIWTGGTGIEVPGQEQFASGMTLYANYPNPFNPTTTIGFDLKKRSEVSLEIMDISGRLVRTLVNETRSVGTHEVSWDSRDDFGNTVASGVYISRLESRGQMVSQKMLLIR